MAYGWNEALKRRHDDEQAMMAAHCSRLCPPDAGPCKDCRMEAAIERIYRAFETAQ